jgi:predicted DNA-binding transcriptional regulator YafY
MIDYVDAEGQASRRTIRPLRVYQRNTYWYINAYCQRDHAERTFRVDRVRGWAEPRIENREPRTENRELRTEN